MKAELSVTMLHPGIFGKVLSHIIEAEQNHESVFQGSNPDLGRLIKESVSIWLLSAQASVWVSDSYSEGMAVLWFSMP